MRLDTRTPASRPPEPPPGSLSPRLQGRVLLPLRAFLGFTFCFAGLQKLANPGFFQAGNTGSIQAQMAGSARLSPIGGLISPLAHLAVPLGLLIAVAELAIGVGTLLGLWQRLAAAGGVALSFLLFLTVSFRTAPYYTGADIVFTFAWMPLALAGAGPFLSADAAIAARLRNSAPASEEEASRREAMLKGAVTAAAAIGGLVLGGAAAGIGRLAGGTKNSSGAVALKPPSPPRPHPAPHPKPSAATPKTTPKPSPSPSRPAGTAIGSAGSVPVGGSASFSDPGTGSPSLVVQPTSGTFVAFTAVCPHAGCTVAYEQSSTAFVCPCHGSQFNGATGAVEAGPAATGLTPIPVTKGGDGQLYAT